MDFNNFVITGPNSVTTSINFEAGGSITNSAPGVPINQATQCQTDTFSMTGISGAVPPVICGTNTGYHGTLITATGHLFS